MQADHIIKYSSDHPMMAPQINAIRLSGGNKGKSEINQENILNAYRYLRDFVGQTPKIIKAKKSVAGFKLRKGTDLLVLVTIRDKGLLEGVKNRIIQTLLYPQLKAALLNNHIQFGLIEAGFNVNIYLKGNVSEGRGLFFKSTLLIP